MRTIELPGKPKSPKRKLSEIELKLAEDYRRNLITPSTEQQTDPYAVRETDSRPSSAYRPKQYNK